MSTERSVISLWVNQAGYSGGQDVVAEMNRSDEVKLARSVKGYGVCNPINKYNKLK